MMNHAVEVSHVAKSFGATQAVADVSFAVEQGEIFGLLGPNGAGKTTTIRLILDIFRPDGGTVSILDGPMTEEKKDRVGYMPEERGLYQDMVLEQCLVYLGRLKGMSKGDAQQRAGVYLGQFDLAQHKQKKVKELSRGMQQKAQIISLAQHKRKKVKELSRGMQQKAQIISTVLHGPELLILDEPFSGLDPVNTQLVKDLMLELREAGTTIIMSTHMMRQVEELCDRIVLIDDGYNVLYGELDQIQRDHSGHAVVVRVAGELPQMTGVETVTSRNGALHLTLSIGASPQDILQQLLSNQVTVEQFEIAMPTLDEIFIRTVNGQAD
jgi:ABC-2 type transport system ATP-binding protein